MIFRAPVVHRSKLEAGLSGLVQEDFQTAALQREPKRSQNTAGKGPSARNGREDNDDGVEPVWYVGKMQKRDEVERRNGTGLLLKDVEVVQADGALQPFKKLDYPSA